jgi:predicted PhzF superfamily epimerase YddE/YHI9
VTGSAHCALAPYWFEKLNSNSNEGESEKTALAGYQASARGGEVGVSMSDSGKRVLLSGYSVTIMKSKLLV